jgi:hypothetical protein
MNGLTKDDILRMAREAGFEHIAEANYWHPLFKRFADLVAAAEREECAKLADDKLMDTSALMSFPPKSSAAWSIAVAIRARGAP